MYTIKKNDNVLIHSVELRCCKKISMMFKVKGKGILKVSHRIAEMGKEFGERKYFKLDIDNKDLEQVESEKIDIDHSYSILHCKYEILEGEVFVEDPIIKIYEE